MEMKGKEKGMGDHAFLCIDVRKSTAILDFIRKGEYVTDVIQRFFLEMGNDSEPLEFCSDSETAFASFMLTGGFLLIQDKPRSG
jgi:hypothetical protein